MHSLQCGYNSQGQWVCYKFVAARGVADTTLIQLPADWTAIGRDEVLGASRQFSTGATRDTAEGKPDYDGYLSPLVLRRYAQYMTKHRVQSDGRLRASDNWQKGIPQDEYRKSLWRHMVDFLTLARGWSAPGVDVEEAVCGILFNASGWLHERLKVSEQNIPAEVPMHEPSSPPSPRMDTTYYREADRARDGF